MTSRITSISGLILAITILGCGTSPPQVDGYLIPTSALVIDLSHAVVAGEGPLGESGYSSMAADKKDGNPERFIVAADGGTTLLAPAATIEGPATIERLGVGSFVGPAIVIDVSSEVERDPDYLVTIKDLTSWSERYGEIPAGAIVFVRTGWDVRWGRSDLRVSPSRDLYMNADESGVPHYPGVHPNVMRHLLKFSDVQGVAIDAPGVDRGIESASKEASTILHRAGRWVITDVMGLDRLPPKGSAAVVAPLALVGASRAPTRVFAFVPRS